MSTPSRKHKSDEGDESSSTTDKNSKTSPSAAKKRRVDEPPSSSTAQHPILQQLPPHLQLGQHPGGDLGESLRISQVARLLDASAEAMEGGILGHSGLGTSTDASFWKMLYVFPFTFGSGAWVQFSGALTTANRETEDPSEVTSQMTRTAELQQQLLKTAHLLRSSQDGVDNAFGEGNGNHAIQDPALFASQMGHQQMPSLSQSQLLSALMGSQAASELIGEGVEFPPLSASTASLLASFVKQEPTGTGGTTIAAVAGAALPPAPTQAAVPAGAQSPTFSSPAPTTGKKGGGRRGSAASSSSTRAGSTSPAMGVPAPGNGATAAPTTGPTVAGLHDTGAAMAQLSQIVALEEAVDNQLKAMKFQQIEVIDSGFSNRTELEKLHKTQAELRKQIDQSILRLEQLNDNHILTATDAHRVVSLVDLFTLHARRLRLYQEELFQAQSGQPVKPVAALVITRQPFPCTVKQSKSVDDPVDVVLITGAKSEIQALGQVKAELINEDYNPISKKKNTSPAIQNAAETMDESLSVTFKRLIFPHGSRVKSVNMRFAQEVTMNGVSMRLLSEPTKPFIVMTNHGQRSTTEGKLLKKHTFANRSEIPWPAFANAMQLHYIRATKQDPKKPARPLSNKDIEYLHIAKFNGKLSINQEDYDQFWAWFGTILYKIRNHQKHILPMWIKGLIYGFLSREDSDRLLLTQGALPGSFLIRFSDRCAGQFVVVYVTTSNSKKADGGDEREVKHYLINPEDIEKKSTLPDFLRDCENLWYLLQVVRDPETGVVSLRPKNKDELMAPYYSREKSQTLLLGYDNRQP